MSEEAPEWVTLRMEARTGPDPIMPSHFFLSEELYCCSAGRWFGISVPPPGGEDRWECEGCHSRFRTRHQVAAWGAMATVERRRAR